MEGRGEYVKYPCKNRRLSCALGSDDEHPELSRRGLAIVVPDVVLR